MTSDCTGASLTAVQTVVNCVRTIHLFTSAYPAVLSGMNAATLLPYLKNATTVRSPVVSRELSALMQRVAGGTSHFRLSTSYFPSHDTLHAEDRSEVWSGASVGSAAYDHQTFTRLRPLGSGVSLHLMTNWFNRFVGPSRECCMHVCYRTAYNA